jgi:L,D-transpeptidase catalytic domain
MKAIPALGRFAVVFAMVALGLLTAMGSLQSASARNSRDANRDELAQSRRAGPPMLAIVSLSDQRVTIYDAEGKILQSPVSTGSTGYETPAGIYSVVQKKAVHQSNVYEDGNMPFMQRITWTGIALHAGVLPGHPASHGCVRMPLAFAERLFGLTDIGLRVIVVRDDIAPADIAHPALFKPDPARREASLSLPVNRPSGSEQRSAARVGLPASETDAAPGSARHLQILKSIADAKTAEAEAAGKRTGAAKQAAARKAAEATPATKLLRAAESNYARAEELLKAAETQLEKARSVESAPPDAVNKAELAKEKAAAKVAETQGQVQAAKLQAEAKMAAAERAGEEAKAAEAARDVAVEQAEEATRKTSPVSVFISRKTQRLYIRQGYQPVFEAPITIRDADKPIGSYVFTALSYVNSAEVRWSVVSMYKGPAAAAAAPHPPAKHGRADSRGETAPADVAGAKAALDRIAIPRDALERISQVVLPGSSLIISDESASIETGKDTDFVVLMSGEPQGGIKTRRREPRFRNDDFFGGPPFGGFRMFWN